MCYLYFPYSVVKFRHTGDHPCSGGEGESPPGQPYGLAAELRGLESLALGDGAPVPREFANPTDGIKKRTLKLLKQSYFCDPSTCKDLNLSFVFIFICFFTYFYRHFHGGGCSGGYWLRDVSVETLHPYRTGLGKQRLSRCPTRFMKLR